MAALFYPPMSKIKLIILSGLCISYTGAAFADIYIDSSLFAYSEPVTVKGAMNNWSGPFRGGQAAITHNWLETGVSQGPWRLGIFKRYDYELEFSPDTADFIYRMENKQALQAGKTYQLDLRVRHSYSEGVRLSHEFHPEKGLSLALGLSYLRGLRLTEGALQGEATAVSANDYDFKFDVDYFYSKDSLFDREVHTPSGQGYSLDLLLVWRPDTQLTASLTVKDLVGRIDWRNTPRTRATASSDVKEYDENGYVIYRPVLSGYESNEDFTQILPRKSSLLVSYRVLPTTRLVTRIYHTPAVTLTQVGQTTSCGSQHRCNCFICLMPAPSPWVTGKGNFYLR